MEELLRGSGIKEIAQSLSIAPSTTSTYKARLFAKLGVNNEMDLYRLVRLHGLHPG